MEGTSARQLQSRCKIDSRFCKSTKMYIQLYTVYTGIFPHSITITLSSIVVSDFLPPLVMTSLLEQAPDWLTRREYPPKFRFFNLRYSGEWRIKRSIRAALFTPFAPQDCLSRLCIDLTCKSFARNASFASGVNQYLNSGVSIDPRIIPA